ncbi:DUF2080 family transposase-associated protein [Candidatus Nitrosocosmicus sp. T]
MSYDEQYSLIHNYLLNHELHERETIVTAHGNSGRISMPKTWVGKRVKFWVTEIGE